MAHGRPDIVLGTSGLAVPVVLGAFVILSLTLLGSITDHWVRVKLAGAEALRESEERYRTVVSEIDEVIFRTDADGPLDISQSCLDADHRLLARGESWCSAPRLRASGRPRPTSAEQVSALVDGDVGLSAGTRCAI